MPRAARITDNHKCPKHGGGPISTGSSDVFIGYLEAARVGDKAQCKGAVDVIADGASNVFINGREAARISDPTEHGGQIVVGCSTVNIGESSQSLVLKVTSEDGTPFAEECSGPVEDPPLDPAEEPLPIEPNEVDDVDG
jgi:uncharacterized Zn-binding protein involved in type VI secretion